MLINSLFNSNSMFYHFYLQSAQTVNKVNKTLSLNYFKKTTLRSGTIFNSLILPFYRFSFKNTIHCFCLITTTYKDLAQKTLYKDHSIHHIAYSIESMTR